MIFGNHVASLNSKVMINGVEIERVSEIKFLGIVINNKLCCMPHTNYIKAKISKSTAILYEVKDRASLCTLYCWFTSLTVWKYISNKCFSVKGVSRCNEDLKTCRN